MARAAKKKAGKPGPKPRGPFADKRRTLTTRITDQTRQRLEDAAAATDRSLSQEIEMRLERSFTEEANLEWAYKQIIGDEALHRAIMTVSLFARSSREDPWMPWYKDPALREEAANVFLVELDREAAILNADADKVPSGKTHKRPARKRVVRK